MANENTARIAANERAIAEINAKIAHLRGRYEAQLENILAAPEMAAVAKREAAEHGMSHEAYVAQFIERKVAEAFPAIADGPAVPTVTDGVRAFRAAIGNS